MSEAETLSQRWRNYRPSKKLWAWSLVGTAVMVMIVGFTAGGWKTAGYVAVMTQQGARDARAELAANVCVNKFVAAHDAAQKLAALKDISMWQRDDFIRQGGWAKLAGMDKSVPGAVALCVNDLVAMEKLPARKIEITPDSG